MSERNLMPQQRMAELQARAQRMRAMQKSHDPNSADAGAAGNAPCDEAADATVRLRQEHDDPRTHEARTAIDDELHEIDVRERKKRITVMLVAEIIVAVVFIVGVIAFASMSHNGTLG